MERFEVFRTKDPHVSTWLQKNGFQKRRAKVLMETGKKTTKCNQEETQPAAQTKEVRFDPDRHMDIKNPTLVSVKQTVSELGRTYKTERQINGRLSNLTEMPPIGSSSVQPFGYQEKAEALQDGNIYARQQRIRSYSSPPNNRPKLFRRYSTQSLFTDRPSNIPVLIRNNDVRLRKYSCPEYYSTSTNLYYNDVKESRELDTKGLAKRTATNVSSNTSQQLAKKHGNQTTREQTEVKNKPSILGVKSSESRPAKNGSALLKKEFYDLRGQIYATDINGNEMSPILNRQVSKPTPDDSDNGFGLEFDEEESLQSYSLEALPKKPPKETMPSSMYNTKSTMLTWLGEVNRNNPQFWS